MSKSSVMYGYYHAAQWRTSYSVMWRPRVVTTEYIYRFVDLDIKWSSVGNGWTHLSLFINRRFPLAQPIRILRVFPFSTKRDALLGVLSTIFLSTKKSPCSISIVIASPTRPSYIWILLGRWVSFLCVVSFKICSISSAI